MNVPWEAEGSDGNSGTPAATIVEPIVACDGVDIDTSADSCVLTAVQLSMPSSYVAEGTALVGSCTTTEANLNLHLSLDWSFDEGISLKQDRWEFLTTLTDGSVRIQVSSGSVPNFGSGGIGLSFSDKAAFHNTGKGLSAHTRTMTNLPPLSVTECETDTRAAWYTDAWFNGQTPNDLETEHHPPPGVVTIIRAESLPIP